VFAITDEGKRVLEENPKPFDNQYLTRYESFRTFASSSAKKKDSSDEPDSQPDSQTPDDLLEESYEKITGNLAEELLAEVVKVSPTTFEQLVIDLLRKMGYGTFENAGKTTVASGDEGIDGVIMEDKLGFSLIYIQAKKWDLDSTVGRPAIQNFVGAISGKGGKGLFVTTAKFSAPAIEYAEQQHIILVDGKKLARLMIEHNFCVSVKRTFEIKAIDTDGINEYLE
jgi:restriction system protein